jgi:hypothetical protein
MTLSETDPAGDSPKHFKTAGTSGEAEVRSEALTAYPSIAELSQGGNEIPAIRDSETTLPSVSEM